MNEPQPGQLRRSGAIIYPRSGRARTVVLAIPHLHRCRDHNTDRAGSANLASLEKKRAVTGQPLVFPYAEALNVGSLDMLQRALAASLSVACLVADGHLVHAQQSPDASVVIWESTANDAASFATELSLLYTSLYNTKRLTVKRVVADLPYSDAEVVVRRSGSLIGPVYPPALDSLLCDLNPAVCSRDRADQSTGNLNQSIDGSLPSKTHWNIHAGTTLIVPAVILQQVPRWIKASVPAESSIEREVLVELGGCNQFDADCKQEILRHNRSLDESALNDKKPKTLLLPIIAALAKVDLTSSHEQINAIQTIITNDTTLKPVDDSKDLFKIDRQNNANSTFTEQQTLRSAESVRSEFKRNSIGILHDFGKFSTGIIQQPAAIYSADMDAERKALRELIKFPYSSMAEYPADVKNGRVAIYDGWVDGSHCAFSPGLIEVHNIPAVLHSISDRGHCDQEIASNDEDHGTLIAGIIGARLPNGQASGLNPYAHVITEEVDFKNLSKAQTLLDMAANLDDVSGKADVVNFSFGYGLDPNAGARDPLLTTIANWSGRVLYVAAAGNAGIDETYLCDVRPACFDMPNVIAVAGLDRNIDAPSLSAIDGQFETNYGSRIHVGAIGEKVFSTVVASRYGVMYGSSPAAPQVTAVASLMMERYRHHTPQEIKNRIIYCSDFIDVLGDKLFGGRLDATCSLDGFAAHVRLKTNADDTLVGYFQSGTAMKFSDAQSGREITIDIASIRALRLSESKGTFTMFYNTDRNNRDSPLLKETNLVPLDDKEANRPIPFHRAGGAVISIRLGDIVRYVSAI